MKRPQVADSYSSTIFGTRRQKQQKAHFHTLSKNCNKHRKSNSCFDEIEYEKQFSMVMRRATDGFNAEDSLTPKIRRDRCDELNNTDRLILQEHQINRSERMVEMKKTRRPAVISLQNESKTAKNFSEKKVGSNVKDGFIKNMFKTKRASGRILGRTRSTIVKESSSLTQRSCVSKERSTSRHDINIDNHKGRLRNLIAMISKDESFGGSSEKANNCLLEKENLFTSQGQAQSSYLKKYKNKEVNHIAIDRSSTKASYIKTLLDSFDGQVFDHLKSLEILEQFEFLQEKNIGLERELKASNLTVKKVLKIFDNYKKSQHELCLESKEICTRKKEKIIELNKSIESQLEEINDLKSQLNQEKEFNTSLAEQLSDIKKRGVNTLETKIDYLQSQLEIERRDYDEACSLLLIELVSNNLIVGYFKTNHRNRERELFNSERDQ